MKKDRSTLLIVVILLTFCALLALLMIIDNYKEAHKPRFEFPSTLVVTNTTEYKYLDTLVLVTLHQLFGYDTMRVDIVSMPSQFEVNGVYVSGFIYKDPYINHKYLIFTNPNGINVHSATFIAHEMAHLQQMEKKFLIPLPDLPGQLYLGDTINFLTTVYEDRASEKDAFKLERLVEQDLLNLIYNR